jgi:hypothetical protein
MVMLSAFMIAVLGYTAMGVALAGAGLVALGVYIAAGWTPQPSRFRIRGAALCLGVMTFFGLPQVGGIVARAHSYQAQRHINDGVPQLEAAGRFLLHGVDPYGQDYSDTPMATAWVADMLDNPAWYHLAYPPLLVLASAAGEWMAQDAFDARVLYLGGLALLVAALFLLGRDPEEKLGYVVLTALSPLCLIDFLVGQNDVVFLSMVLAALAALQRRRLLLSGVLFGLAIATKQTALLLLPVYSVLLWQRPSGLRLRLTSVLAAAATASALILPFFLWNPHAYWADTVSYLSAGGPDNYPIHGMGLGMILLSLGAIPTRWTPYPFWIWQLLLGVPVVLIGLRAVWRRPTRSRAFIALGSGLLAIAFLNRAFHQNYMDVGLVLIEMGIWSAVRSWRAERRLGNPQGGHEAAFWDTAVEPISLVSAPLELPAAAPAHA